MPPRLCRVRLVLDASNDELVLVDDVLSVLSGDGELRLESGVLLTECLILLAERVDPVVPRLRGVRLV